MTITYLKSGKPAAERADEDAKVRGRQFDHARLRRNDVDDFAEAGRNDPPEITKITGITNEMVAGHRIDDRVVHDLLGSMVLGIAHNANFDRRFLEKRLPAFATKHLGVQSR
jgi:DNA polymerase III epsilon subunit-like protein